MYNYEYTYELVSATEDPLDIALHNMKCADKILNLEMFIGGSIGWLQCNPTKNYKDLEQELRRLNFDTHLIASECKLTDPRYVLGFPYRIDDRRTYKYECIYSCRPKKFALVELLTHSVSYEENLEKLNDSAALMTIIKNETDEMKITELYENIPGFTTDIDIPIMDKLSKNLVKCVLTRIDAKQYMGLEMAKLREKGYSPTLEICSAVNECIPVLGIVIDRKLAFNMGMYTVNEEGVQVTKLIKLIM